MCAAEPPGVLGHQPVLDHQLVLGLLHEVEGWPMRSGLRHICHPVVSCPVGGPSMSGTDSKRCPRSPRKAAAAVQEFEENCPKDCNNDPGSLNPCQEGQEEYGVKCATPACIKAVTAYTPDYAACMWSVSAGLARRAAGLTRRHPPTPLGTWSAARGPAGRPWLK